MALEVRDACTFYGKSQVLRNVTLAVPPGEITCLLGRNGVGKSTTLKSVMGLVRPRSGSIRFKDRELVGLPPHVIARLGLGYVPEERRIFRSLTVTENLLIGVKPGARRSGGRWSVDDVFAYFPQLERRASSKGRFLSGGEQQLLAIGRALLGDPDVLLLDEPTEGLAPLIVEALEGVIRDISSRGIGVLLVESKLPVALRLATKVYVMSKGEIVYEGRAPDLQRASDVRQRYLEV